ncbi:MAG: hypothetical protein AB7U82_12840 [Blastocatellales bacterium]
MTKTEAQLKDDFPPEVCNALVNAVIRSYESNYSCYDPSIGHSPMVFGLMIYTSKVFFLSQLEDEAKKIKLLQKQPYFSLQVGGYKLSTYCAGRSSDTDVEVSFPLNKTRASIITDRNQAQLKLPFPGFDEPPDDSECREVILADIGNPVDGAIKIFLGIPIKKDKDGRISQWGTTLLLWENEKADAMAGSSEATFYIPTEEVQPPTVTLKGATEQEQIEEIEPPAPTLKDDADHEKAKKAKGDA